MMKPKSSSYARRSLTFEKLPYAGKTFYIDVKSGSAKSKITKRILTLGGQIENFLSKDLSLLITDRTATPHTRDECSQKHPVNSVPLSRGQALLLKASASQNCDSNNNNNGLLQSAAKLGVQTETPAGFLRQSSKLAEKVKAERPASRQEDCLSGMSTISWDSDKESCCVIKVEDIDGLYRPLFKQFDAFPQISYAETGCPFDVGVVLTKAKESNNQSKKKSAGGALRGGYCESCDHWYKCTLREHLNSDKHKEFISAAENFRALNTVSSNLPNLGNFVGKYGLKNNCSSPEVSSDKQSLKDNYAECDSNNHDKQVVQNKLSAFEESTSEAHKSLPRYENICSVSKQTDTQRHASKTEPVFKFNLESEYDVNKDTNSQPVRLTEESHFVPQFQRTAENLGTNALTKSPFSDVHSEKGECKIENHVSRTKASMSNKVGRLFSVDDVIKSVTENEDYFSSGDGDAGKDFMSKTSMIITRHLTSDTSTNVSSNLSNCINANTETGVSGKEKRSKKENEEGSSRFKNLPAMCFSSSSCSFGDNGVGNVMSFLNSQHSRKSWDKEVLNNGKLPVENDSVVEGSKSGSSWALELPETKDDSENISEDNGNAFVSLNDEISGEESDMPMLEAVEDSEDRVPDLDLMPVLESYDSEDLGKFCTSILNDDKVGKTNALMSIGLPEYSNITEESLQDKLQIETKHTFGKNLKTNFEVPVLDFGSSILKAVGTIETPDKRNMSNLKSNIYENHANSGSTIRNWLLPNDDSASVRSVCSPGNLNVTLVNTSCNIGDELQVDQIKDSKNIDGVKQQNECLSNVKETVDSSKVADWIQNQDFIETANLCENSRLGFEENILEDTDFTNSVNKQDNENFESDSNHFKDLKSCSERKFRLENENLEEVSNGWSDSGTSISDCTLDNFRTGRGLDNDETESAVNKETKKATDPEILNHDEMSQDSGISAKTGLTSVVTAKGIKITGLSSLSSHYFNAAESEQFNESSNAVSDRQNSECSNTYNVNKMLPDNAGMASHCVQNLIGNKLNTGNSQTLPQNCSTTNALHIPSSLNTCLVTETNVQASTLQQMTNARDTKTKPCPKPKSQTKPRKPRASKNTKSTKQIQSQNLLTQVLASTVYSPISSTLESSQNGYTDQENSRTSQTIPYCQGKGQENGAGEFIIGQNQSAHMNTQVYHHNQTGYGMMDLLLSPGHQVNTAFPQTKFQQNVGHQQQYASPQTQQSSVSCNGPFMSSLLTHPNVNHQFGVLPFSQVYQNPTSQNSIDNHHHFLSSNSNFLMQNWNTGTSVKQQNQVPENHWNYPTSQGFLSHDNSNSTGSLQTIDTSRIADNSDGCESNFNFKIADTNKLKRGRAASRKPLEQKAAPPVNSRHNIYNNTLEGITTYNSVQLNNKGVYNGSDNRNQSSSSQSMSYNSSPCTNASINRPYENISPYPPSVPVSHVQQNNYHYQQHQMHMNYSRSQNMQENIQNYDTIHHEQTDRHRNMYNTVQTGDTKLKIRRMPASGLAPASVMPVSSRQQKHDLMQYWNVRKAGDCRLVFSANVGKRKAEETPEKYVYMSHLNEVENSQPSSKRQKCLVY